ncbi:hypothetical protein [Nitrogeniibacter aestuarii]|uniref:hypothetical protein n=1 Tax=Nitrogeniibacter aestuarii TaxID=2815343 RepID=UPI001D11F3CE|nr:hypothetical protein [Nitrogeniibacter aestuarii]
MKPQARLRLLAIVDSTEYVMSNCYQHQLMAALKTKFDLKICSVREFLLNPLIWPNSFDRVLLAMKQRTLLRQVDAVSKRLSGREVFVYDQDPWQAYIDDSASRGAYPVFADRLTIRAILMTTRWWTEFCVSKGVPARFVRMGMLPEYCVMGGAWADRRVALGFQGSLHPHRRKFFDELSALGLHVDVMGSRSYSDYLESLGDIQIYIHTEDDPWCVDGQMIPRNALWIKDVEVAARGCFAIRNWDVDADAYDIDEVPTIRHFKNVSEVPGIVSEIQSMDSHARDDAMCRSVEIVRQRDDWQTVVREIESEA